MAVPNIVVDTTFSGKNITTAVSVYEFTVAATGTYRFQVRLADAAGNGDYSAYLTLNDGDALTDDPLLPKTTLSAASGETAFWFASISLDLIAGDVVNIFVKGLAGDTDEAGSVRIFSDGALQPTVAGRTLDVAAGGEAGLDFANVNGTPPNSAGVTTMVADYARRTGDYAATGDAMALTANERNSTADAFLDRANGIETSFTLRQALRLMLSALAGKLSGAAGTTVTIRDVNDAKNRIVATVDSDGNRTAVTKDVS